MLLITDISNYRFYLQMTSLVTENKKKTCKLIAGEQAELC